MFALKAEFGLGYKQVAKAFEVCVGTVNNSLCDLRRIIGAVNNPHAAWLLWSLIEPLMLGDAGLGLRRRR